VIYLEIRHLLAKFAPDHPEPCRVLFEKRPVVTAGFCVVPDRQVDGEGQQEPACRSRQSHPPAPEKSAPLPEGVEDRKPGKNERAKNPEVDAEQKRGPNPGTCRQHPGQRFPPGFPAHHERAGQEKRVQHPEKWHVVPENHPRHQDHHHCRNGGIPGGAGVAEDDKIRQQAGDRAEREKIPAQGEVVRPGEFKQPGHRKEPQHVVSEKRVHDRPLSGHQPHRHHPGRPALAAEVEPGIGVERIVEQREAREEHRHQQADPGASNEPLQSVPDGWDLLLVHKMDLSRKRRFL
jgi:hypothetical protein